VQVFYCFLLFVNLTLCQQSNNPPFKIAITAESLTGAPVHTLTLDGGL
jgi:hypothetical protein